jgi:hypothetical protein
LTVDFSPFEQDAGCTEAYPGALSCAEGHPISAMCDTIERPSDLLGGLDPSYPIARCSYQLMREGVDNPFEDVEFIYYTGGLLPIGIRYVIVRDGEYALLATEADLAATFAPIESPEEALSYVLAARNLDAYYGLEYDSSLEYFVDRIEDTYVTETDDGYQVHLFFYQLFGCGPHNTYAVDVAVSTDGAITELGQQELFKNPDEDLLCVD